MHCFQDLLAYLNTIINYTCKMFMKLTSGVNVIKNSLYLTLRPNKPEHLYLAITFQASLTIAGNTRSLLKKEASERCYNWVGSGLALQF
jgi:hypothetical protein